MDSIASEDLDKMNPIESMAETGFNKNIIRVEENNVESIPEKEDVQNNAEKLAMIRYAKKAKRASLTEVSEKLSEARETFLGGLGKLSVIETREIGLQEVQRVIAQNVSPNALRVFLSLLAEGHKGVTTIGKELHVLILGNIAKAFGTQLLDPKDKPPNLIKSVARLLEMIHQYLGENSSVVHHACATSAVKVFEYCARQESNETLLILFYAPLESIINGGTSKIAQLGAAHCLLALFRQFKELDGLVDLIFPRFISTFIHSTCDYADFIGVLGVLVDVCETAKLIPNLEEVLSKLAKIVESPVVTNHLSKIEGARVLKSFAIKLKDVTDIAMGYFFSRVLKSLDLACRDRVLKVQNTAKEAKAEWESLRRIFYASEKRKTLDECKGREEVKNERRTPKNYKYSELRDIKKQQSHAVEIEGNSKKLEEISAIWGSAARAAKYLRKRDGAGGGNTYFSPDPAIPYVPYNIKKESLKNQINQCAYTKENNPMPDTKLILAQLAKENAQYKLEDTIPANPQNAKPKMGRTAQEVINDKKKEYEARAGPRPDSPNIDRESVALEDSLQEEKKAFIHPPQNFKPCSKPPPPIGATEYWISASKKLETGNIDSAFKTILSSEDDLYLMRLMMQTGPKCKILQNDTSESVLEKMNQIVRSNSVPQLLLSWIKNSVESGKYSTFPPKLQNELMDTLYELSSSSSELGMSSAQLYNQLKRSVIPH